MTARTMWRSKEKLLPSSFLHLYMKFMENYETARRYDFFTGLWVLSSILGRDVVVNRPGSPINLNLYTLLVGPSGASRKSTAVKHAQRVLEMYYTRTDDPSLFLTARTTPKIVAAKLADQCDQWDHCVVHFCSDELANLLGNKIHVRDMPIMLTELFDCPHRTTGLASMEDGVRELVDVYSTFLGACAPEWLVKSISSEVMEGGFASRLLIAYEKLGKGKYAWSKKEVDAEKLYREGVDRLYQIKELAERYPRIELTRGAIRRYSNWYMTKEESEGKYKRVFEAREQDHVLKIAGLLAADERSFIIDQKHLEFALRLVEECKADGHKVFVGVSIDFGKRDSLMDNLVAIRGMFVDSGARWMPQTTIIGRFCKRLNAKALYNILDAMLTEQLVQHVVEHETGKKGPPRRLWRGTSKLMETDLVEFAARLDQTRAA